LGPLHGVPVTIKECFFVEGTDATVGVERLRNHPSKRDSPLVRRLCESGAIVLGKTNVPQLMAYHESDNPVYGRTNNPWNLNRGPGGSSGGEAAIIAACGSPLGLGNDLGGSLRHPAHVCGIAGFKPTSGWPPLSGCEENFPGLLGLVVQPGPMARCVEDLTLAMRVLTVPEPPAASESDAPPRPWREPAEVRLEGLRVATWEDDGVFRPSPAIRRAVREAAEALRGRGVEVEPFTPPDMRRMMRCYLGVLTSDGGASLKRLLGRSRRDWRIRRMLAAMSVPRWMGPSLAAILRRMGQERMARAATAGGARSADGYRRLGGELRGFARRFTNELRVGRFDAMLLPVHGLPALAHGGAQYAISASSYSFLANVLNAPAGAVPITRVRPGEESDRPDGVDWIERGAKLIERGTAGLPVGVQLIAPPWRDDVTLALMQALEEAFRDRPDYPRRPPEL
jgi:fatty acid amide hydrolase